MGLDSTTQIFYSAAGTRRGPISYAEFIANVEANLIHPDDLVWHEGLPDWVRADTIIQFPDRRMAQPAAPAAEPPNVGKASLSAPKANYLVRHWRGELSLPVSYWLNNIGASIFLFATIVALGAVLDDYDPKSAIALWSVATLVYVVIVIWQLVGTWRSAVNRRAKDGSAWAGVAQLFIVFGWLSFAATLGNTMVPGIKESVAQYDWIQANGKWEVEVLRGGREVVLSGGIGPGFAKAVETIIDTQPRLETMHLNLQNGGLVGEADKARRAIKSKGMRTYVSATCVSACTIVLAGGKERYAASGAKVGFHAPKAPGVSMANNDNTFTKAAYRDAGISDAFIDRVLTTSNTTMWYPTTAELEQARVLDAVVSGDQFAIPNAKEMVASGKVRQALLGNRLFAAVQKVDPQTFEKVVKTSEDGYLAGKTPAEVRNDNLPAVMSLRKTYTRTTSDRAAIGLADMAIKQYAALQKISPEACVDYAAGRDPVKLGEAVSLIPSSLRQEEFDVFAQVVEESGQKDTFIPNEAQAAILHKEVARLVMADDSGRAALINFFNAADGKPHQPGLACLGIISILSQAKRLPAGLPAAYYRLFFSE